MEREGVSDGNVLSSHGKGGVSGGSVLSILEKEDVSNGSVLSSGGKGRGFRWQCTKYTAKGGCQMAMY